MSTRPDKYLPKRQDSPEKMVLNAILQPILSCNPSELKNYIEVLETPYTDPEFAQVYNTNLAVAESLKRMMRFISMSLNLAAFDSNGNIKDDKLAQQSIDWFVK